MKNNRIKYSFLILVIMAFACFLSVKDGHQWGDDFAQYMQQAVSLSEGTTEKFVKDNTFIVLNSPIEMATPVYPWGFPLLLSLFVPFFGENIILYKIICCVIISLMTICFCLFLCNYFDDKKSFMLSLCVGLDYYILKFCNNVVSDIPFLLIMLIIVILMNDYFEKEFECVKLFFLGLIMGYAYMLRSQGIVFILSYFFCNVLYSILNKDKCTKADIISSVIPYIGFIIVFLLDKCLLPHSERSALYFLESMDLNTFLKNILFYTIVLYSYVPAPSRYQLCIYIILSIIVLLGAISLVKKKNTRNLIFLFMCTLMLFGINTLFPWHQGGRYMIPIIPLYILMLGYGVDYLFEILKLNNRIINLLKICICTLFCLYGVLFYGVQNIRDGRQYFKGAYTSYALETYEYINENVKEDEIICFFKPRALYYRTGKLSIKPLGNSFEAIKDYDYLLLCYEDDYLDLNQIESSNNNYGISLEKIFINNNFTMYRINKNG